MLDSTQGLRARQINLVCALNDISQSGGPLDEILSVVRAEETRGVADDGYASESQQPRNDLSERPDARFDFPSRKRIQN